MPKIQKYALRPAKVAGVLAGGKSVFSYNRENFFFDRKQGIEREYQEQDMRVAQFQLYREDIRDLRNEKLTPTPCHRRAPGATIVADA